MAHLLLLIDAPTSINTQFMSHYEEYLYRLDQKRYPLSGKNRTGYCRANISELHFHNIRVKEEVMGYVLRDSGAIILNPKTNNITLWKIITHKPENYDHHNVSIGKSFMIIRWCFKWFNKLGLNKIIGLNPIDAADMNDKDVPYENLNIAWTYIYSFGYLKDLRNKYGEEML